MPQINKIKIRRGVDSSLPAPATEQGELRYSVDIKKLYIDDGTSNIYIGGDVNNFPISTATQTALNLKVGLPSTFTGTAIPLSNPMGSYQVGSANSGTTYTVTGSVLGGWATVLINVATQPTITGGTLITGSTFTASTNMYMNVRYNGSIVEYYFAKI